MAENEGLAGGSEQYHSVTSAEASTTLKVPSTEGRTCGEQLFDAHTASRKDLKTSQEQEAFFVGLSSAFHQRVGERLQENGMPEFEADQRAFEITTSYLKFLDALGKNGLGFGRISESMKETITRSETEA